MPTNKGARYVLVVKRDRRGQWWKKQGGEFIPASELWIKMSDDEAKLYEKAATKAGHTATLENNY